MQSSLHQTLERTCGCVPSQPCGSCSGCNGLCSSHSESPGSRPSDLAYACERACSSASRNHNAPSSPLQTTMWGSVSTIYIFYILQKLVMWGGRAYPLRCPRGRDGLAPSSLWPPPPCCCQLLQRECFPCGRTERIMKLKQCLAVEGVDDCWGRSREWCSADVFVVVIVHISAGSHLNLYMIFSNHK